MLVIMLPPLQENLSSTDQVQVLVGTLACASQGNTLPLVSSRQAGSTALQVSLFWQPLKKG